MIGQNLAHRERTRILLDLGELLEKSELPTLVGGDRAIIFAALEELVERARGDAERTKQIWRTRSELTRDADNLASALRRAVADR